MRRLAAIWVVLILALAPLVQGQSHPVALGQAVMAAAHDHAHAQGHAHAHHHGAQTSLDHDHIPVAILPSAKQPPLWPQARPSYSHHAPEALALAEGLRRPPRAV